MWESLVKLCDFLDEFHDFPARFTDRSMRPSRRLMGWLGKHIKWLHITAV